MSRRVGRRSDKSRKKFVQQLAKIEQANAFATSLMGNLDLDMFVDEYKALPFAASDEDSMRNIINHILCDATKNIELTQQDLEGCEYFFFESFLIDVSVEDEDEIFSMFADFYACRSKRFQEFAEKATTLRYCNIRRIGVRRYFLQLFVSLLYGGSKCGDTYSQSVLKVLYQTYYKKEYKILKKFPHISWKELKLFEPISDDDNNLSIDTNVLSRVLCMSSVYRIDVSACAIIFKMLDDLATQEQEKRSKALDERMVKVASAREQFIESDELQEEIEQFINNLPTDDGRFSLLEKIYDVLRILSLDIGLQPEQFQIDIDRMGLMNSISIAYWAIQRSEVKTDIPLSTLVQIIEPFVLFFGVLSDQSYLFEAVSDSMLLQYEPYGNANVLRSVYNLCGTKKDAVQKQSKLKDAVKAVTAEVKTAAESQDEKERLENEVRELKEKLRVSQNDFTHLRKEFDSEKTKKEELERELSEREVEKQELIRLREFVYKEAEDEINNISEESKASYEEMKKAISDKAILIIGGNDNWIKKIRNEFPKWKFVAANVSPSVSANIIKTCERAYFFTDTLGHSNYAKFIGLARLHNKDFSYMHGVNLQKNVQQVYEDLVESNT